MDFNLREMLRLRYYYLLSYLQFEYEDKFSKVKSFLNVLNKKNLESVAVVWTTFS